MKLWKKPMRLILLVFILAILIWVIQTAVSIYQYASVNQTRAADCAIILGCAVEQDEPSPVFRERIHHGVWLYQEGYVNLLIFTGGIGDGDTVSEAAAAKDDAMSLGIPEDAIMLEEKSRITQENLEYSRSIMEEAKLQNALLVSDGLHMKRAMLMAQDYGVTAYASPTTTSLYKTPKSIVPFLARETVLYMGYSIVRLFFE